MKRGRLPLTAMRSFEAAGRLLSFSHAAEELFVSQAAISRQIRELEAFIGKPLFERLHRRVELTEAGRFLLDQLTTSFDDIDRAAFANPRRAGPGRASDQHRTVFASGWLVPRLNRFREQHPEIDVSVDANIRLVEFRGHEAEMAIRHAAVARSWPRTEARHLFDCRITPVLTPGLLASGPPLASPADLRHYTLLHDYDRKPGQAGFGRSALRTSRHRRVRSILTGRRPFRPRSSATVSLSATLCWTARIFGLGTLSARSRSKCPTAPIGWSHRISDVSAGRQRLLRIGSCRRWLLPRRPRQARSLALELQSKSELSQPDPRAGLG